MTHMTYPTIRVVLPAVCIEYNRTYYVRTLLTNRDVMKQHHTIVVSPELGVGNHFVQQSAGRFMELVHSSQCGDVATWRRGDY